MINQPEAQQPKQDKLVLPAYPDDQYRDIETYSSSSTPPYSHIRPDQLIRQQTTPPPKQPVDRLRYYWRKDPSYKVFMIAIGMVLIAGLIFVSLVSNALLRNPKLFALDNTLSQTPPTGVVPLGTVDLRPTFPPPGGGKGTGSSSQPPSQSTPALQPTTVQASPQPGGPLTVQITSIPNRVFNNSIVDVSVNTNLPNVTVDLVALYTVPPYRAVVGPVTTDGSGNATLSWSVSVYIFGSRTQASVYAVAKDQNGQRVQSQAVNVQITRAGG
jgi:hypothetical protein